MILDIFSKLIKRSKEETEKDKKNKEKEAPAQAQAAKPAEKDKKGVFGKMAEKVVGKVTQAQLDAEIKKLPPQVASQLNKPEVRERVLNIANAMMKDGVNIKKPKDIRNWLKTHPEVADGLEPGAKKPETFKREGEKIGPNDNCPCGSGKKYKKCCAKK